MIFILGGFVTGLWAQEEADKWDVNNPPGLFETHTFSLEEGTWMNLDLSPDGRQLVFDLLGDIYLMPATGGEAKVLRSGLAWEVQPRFSPDGSKILFTSDAGGGDNIWVMNADGSDARQVTHENFRLLNNPAWMPDGMYFVARKHFTSERSLGAGEIWMYHLSGGSGLQLTKRKNDQQDVNEPCPSPDGRYVYFSEDMYPGGYFQYNKDPNKQIYQIRRYDLETGEIRAVTGGMGSAFRPQISHDGKYLAFVRRVRTKSTLFIRELSTGKEFALYDDLSKDQQEAWAIFGVYTGFAWSPDDSEIYIWAKGKIRKVNVKTREVSTIPFHLRAEHKMMETVRFEHKVFEPEFDVKVIRHAVTSPDGKQLVFSAVGYLWKKDLPNGKPVRLTSQQDMLEFEPAFSPDGKYLVYVSWNDEEYGRLWKLRLSDGFRQMLSDEPGIYRTPSFSPDGRQIVFRREAGNGHQGSLYCTEPGIYRMSAEGGEAVFVCREGEYPLFNADGTRIFYQTGGYLFGAIEKNYYSVDLNGHEKRHHFKAPYAQRIVPSPDNRWVAWSELYKVYVAPMPETGKAISLSANSKAVPVAQVARDAGINIHWSPDSKVLHWMLGPTYFTDTLSERFSFLRGGRADLPPMDSTGIETGLRLASDLPKGIIAFTHARIITMEGEEVIEDGSIVVEGNRIRAVGPASEVRIPRKAKVYDCSGKTIMPGIIDVHAHVGNFRYGLSPQKQWQYYANLAYGVTTSHDPSSNSEMIFSQAEMIRAGNMTGPRLYSTGVILYGADGDFKAVINNLDDARSAIRRTKAYGAFSVKSYNQPRREQRQQVIQAARELGVLVVPEGGSFFYHNMNMLADGHTGIEHNIPVAPLYEDVLEFWAATKAHNTPTLIVNYGGLNGEYYWYQHTEVWKKERLLRFTPRSVVDGRSRHRTMIPEEEYENGHILVSQSCKRLSDKGVRINLGAHGQLQGLGAHWELWMLHQGGMSEMEALRAATINGAIYLGMESEIGSLKAGKLADLIVIDGNPLEDIFSTEQVVYTMVNGRLYESETMREIGHYDKPCGKFYFQLEGSNEAFLQWGEGHGPGVSGCSCGE